MALYLYKIIGIYLDDKSTFLATHVSLKKYLLTSSLKITYAGIELKKCHIFYS